jgi:hypothetical protein
MPLPGFLASGVGSGLVKGRQEPVVGLTVGTPAVAGHPLGTQTPLIFLRYCAGEATVEAIGMMKVRGRVCKTSKWPENIVTFVLIGY